MGSTRPSHHVEVTTLREGVVRMVIMKTTLYKHKYMCVWLQHVLIQWSYVWETFIIIIMQCNPHVQPTVCVWCRVLRKIVCFIIFPVHKEKRNDFSYFEILR
jgi:hypothetical protein